MAAEPQPELVSRPVADEDEGARLDRFLARQPGVDSRAAAERLIAGGHVTVDGRKLAKSHKLRVGELIEYRLVTKRPQLDLEPESIADVEVRHEDEHLLVVEKPPGVVVHPSAGHASGTLVHALLHHGVSGGTGAFRPGIVHRLDRDTSGLLVVARSDEAHRRLARMIRARTLRREYTALIRGRPTSWRGRIEAPIGRDRRDATRQSLETDRPRPAFTDFSVSELLAEHALLQVVLETGRTHQIRVHLSAIGLPVSGDPVYGVPGDLELERQFLHASRLAFKHPFEGHGVDVVSELPAELARALAQAREGREERPPNLLR
jgi:23S rRNA pseudouridine1911/1915/1917 synthase